MNTLDIPHNGVVLIVETKRTQSKVECMAFLIVPERSFNGEKRSYTETATRCVRALSWYFPSWIKLNTPADRIVLNRKSQEWMQFSGDIRRIMEDGFMKIRPDIQFIDGTQYQHD